MKKELAWPSLEELLPRLLSSIVVQTINRCSNHEHLIENVAAFFENVICVKKKLISLFRLYCFIMRICVTFFVSLSLSLYSSLFFSVCNQFAIHITNNKSEPDSNGFAFFHVVLNLMTFCDACRKKLN